MMSFRNSEKWGKGKSFRQREQGPKIHNVKSKGGLETGSHQKTLSQEKS